VGNAVVQLCAKLRSSDTAISFSRHALFFNSRQMLPHSSAA
jgi:hypothetical protein